MHYKNVLGRDKQTKHFFWQMVQFIGVIFVTVGVCLELYTRQDIYFFIITAGSLIFALGTKFMYYRRKPDHRTGKPETHTIKGKLKVD